MRFAWCSMELDTSTACNNSKVHFVGILIWLNFHIKRSKNDDDQAIKKEGKKRQHDTRRLHFVRCGSLLHCCRLLQATWRVACFFFFQFVDVSLFLYHSKYNFPSLVFFSLSRSYILSLLNHTHTHMAIIYLKMYRGWSFRISFFPQKNFFPCRYLFTCFVYVFFFVFAHLMVFTPTICNLKIKYTFKWQCNI